MYVIILFLIFVYYLKKYKNGIYIKSNFDDIFYKLKSKKNSKESLLYLSNLRSSINILVNNLDKSNIVYQLNKNRFDILKIKLKNLKISENLDSRTTSYTVNKGDEIVLCIRKNNIFYDFNEVFYILLHEISHIVCPEIGHTKLFYDINKFLIKQAIKQGIYKFKNYSLNPIDYCGLKLNENLL